MAMTSRTALLYGTAAVAILDGLDAVVFFGLRGVPPFRVFQAIASGLLGRGAFSGGWATAALGAALHVFISFTVVLVFLLASRWIPALRRAPVLSGLAYGIAVYLVMNLIVIPLSAAVTGPPSWPVILNGIGVGLPASLAARAVPLPQGWPAFTGAARR